MPKISDFDYIKYDRIEWMESRATTRDIFIPLFVVPKIECTAVGAVASYPAISPGAVVH